MSRRGRNWSLSKEWWASGMEWLLSTPNAWLHTFGISKDDCTFCENLQWLLWPGTPCSSCHQASMSICQACHFIHSTFSMVEGSGSLGVEVHERPSPAPVLAGNISSPLRNSWHEVLEAAGTQSLLPQAWTNWIGHLVPFHPPMLAGGVL